MDERHSTTSTPTYIFGALTHTSTIHTTFPNPISKDNAAPYEVVDTYMYNEELWARRRYSDLALHWNPHSLRIT